MKLHQILLELPRVDYADIEDDMEYGPKWKRKQEADAESKENEWRASERVKELAYELKNLISQAYDSFQAPYINYKVKTVNVKIGGVRGHKLTSPAVLRLNAMLDQKFKGEITRRKTRSSVLYHIPYDIFDEKKHNETQRHST